MGMQIDGSGTTARINPYSRSALPGEKPRESEADGAVSVGRKTEAVGEKKKEPAMPGSKNVGDNKDDPQKEAQVQQQIQELIQIQNKVIVHEQAHMSAGGDLAGGASYSHTTGPDGKRYITGGEVSISIPSVKEPEEKVRIMGRVMAAALAPADPSPQDLRVASSAGAKQAEASMELARKRAETAYGAGSGKAGQKIPGAPDTQSGEPEVTKVKKTDKTVTGSRLDISV